MRSLACFRAMDLAQRTHAQLDEGDCLRLEEHLEGCPRCAEDSALLSGFAVASRSTETLDRARRQRALARALDAPRDRAPRRAPSVSRMRIVIAVAAALVLGLSGLALALSLRSAPPGAGFASPEFPSPEFPSPGPSEAAADGTARSEATSPPSGVRRAELAEGEVFTMEGASAEALRPSAVDWDPSDATLRVSRGALRVEVESGRARPFAVIMPRYRVEVLGTIFVVDDTVVSVERGKVRVQTSTGGQDPRVLEAGERWEIGESSAVEGAPDDPPAPSTTGRSTVGSTPAKRPVDVKALFAEARRELAAREPKRARRIVQRALASGLSPAQEAEAQTLLAECSLVAGDPEDASRRYAEVARKHKNLPAAETALFAAARSAHGAGRKDDARRLFRGYLARYPKGQFADEARARLGQLSR